MDADIQIFFFQYNATNNQQLQFNVQICVTFEFEKNYGSMNFSETKILR
jgi:hypothetical protein